MAAGAAMRPPHSALGLAVAVAMASLGGCVGAGGGPSLPDPAVTRGAALAGRWCGQCHGPEGAAPAFAEIAGRSGRDYMYLTNFMADLHLPMPTYRLWADERADVVQYILSLKRP